MKLPYLPANAGKSKQQIITFGGIQYGQAASDGELLDSLGLSSAQFPCLTQRDGRKLAGSYASPTGLYSRGKLCVVDGTDFLYGGEVVGQVVAGEKQFATINTKIVIFPDKVFYDTSSGEFGALEASYQVHPGTLTFAENSITLPASCYMDLGSDTGTVSNVPSTESITVYTGVKVDPATGALTFTGNAQKVPAAIVEKDIIQYGCLATEYMVVRSVTAQDEAHTEYRIEYELHASTLYKYPAFTEAFKEGDAVELTGCTSFPDNNKTPIIRSISERTLTFYDGTFKKGVEAAGVEIARKVPDLSVICECDNRIWGAEGTTIWASALGDPSNFHVYDGLSTDSFAVAVGSDGEFTGCVAYGSNVLFWKEHCVHKILGTNPKNYELYTYTVQGLQAGSEKSLVIINETLFYKGRGGVYAYTGGVPELISFNFGTRRFDKAVAGSDGERYYISMREENTETWGLYVYDTKRGIWLREDGTHAADFANLDGVLYYLDANSKKVYMTGQDYKEEGRIDWSATLTPFTEGDHGRKGYSKLYLRADLEGGSWFKVEVSADGGPFRQVFVTSNERAKTQTVPIFPTRCDNFRVRLSGTGRCVIKSLVREFDVGSEV